MEVKHFDIVIVGGGAAGIMSAITAKANFPDKKVLIVDRTFSLGRKILVCGAGRCNLTNINLQNINSLTKHFYTTHTDKELILKVFENFNYDAIVYFFEGLGVEMYTERKSNIGKVFPITDSAKTILEILTLKLQELGIEIFLNTEVKAIDKTDDFKIDLSQVSLTQRQITDFGFDPKYNENLKEFQISSEFLVMSAGGKTYPTLGSNGSGYEFASSLGHTVIPPVPSALPLVSQNILCKKLSGQKMDLLATSFINGVKIKESFDDVMFTDYGLSGPAILNLSRDISIDINRNHNNNSFVRINFLVDSEGIPRTAKWFNQRFSKTKSIYKSLLGILPNKICEVLDSTFNLESDNPEILYQKLSNLEFIISGTKSWNEAEFTSGGVDLSEVNANLSSKKVDKLYFAGEILDVDGDVGGYNLSWAWASGHTAGKLGN